MSPEAKIWNVEFAGFGSSAAEPAHVSVGLMYPDVSPEEGETRVRHLTIGLYDVRAADDIRVSYDKKRDGWSIEQASTFTWDGDDELCDPDWQEVAFIQAWGREKPDQEPRCSQN